MKKITLLLLLLTVSFGYAQEIPVTFDSGITAASWKADSGLASVGTPDDPETGGTRGKVGQMNSSATGEDWQNAQITFQEGYKKIDLTGTGTNDKKITFDYYSNEPTGGLIKIENGNGAENKELAFSYTTANVWETITIDFNAASGQEANAQYNKIVFFPHLGNGGAKNSTKISYIDNVSAVEGDVISSTTPVVPNIDFESATTWTNFDGGVMTTETNPFNNTDNNSANVGKMVKNAGQTWGGSVLTLDGQHIDFSTHKTFSMKVYSTRSVKVLLKVENATDAGVNFEKELTTSNLNSWETLTFDYSTISTTNTYSKIVLIFDNGTAGDGSANFTFYIDDIVLDSRTLSTKDLAFANVSLYPNPTQGQLNISASETIEKASVYNILGKELKNVTINKTSGNIDVSDLNSGVYFVKYTINNAVGTAKFIKE